MYNFLYTIFLFQEKFLVENVLSDVCVKISVYANTNFIRRND